MSFFVLANFKSHKTLAEVKSWLATVSPTAKKYQDKIQVLVAPAFPHLLTTQSYEPFSLCAQDVSPFPPGAYTGAVNAAQLKDLGVQYCLIGHSERRQFFHETNQDIANKATELVGAGITPILLLSADNLTPQFSALDDSILNQCFYCFEPPSDIGGTVTAPLETITQIVAQIRAHTSSPIFYGGSVTPDNLASLFPLNLSGILVATASLSPSSFQSILEVSAHGS